MDNVKDVEQITEHLLASHTIVWLFDQSSCHRTFAENALNVRCMNVRPGGVQPKMRNTMWGKGYIVHGDGGLDA